MSSTTRARRRLRPSRRRAVSPRQTLSALALSFSGGLLFVTSVPALAVTATAKQPVEDVYHPAPDEIVAAPQKVEVADDIEHAVIAPVSYDVEVAPPPVAAQVAGLGTVALGESRSVVWPVADPSRTSSGFGPRSAPCAGCSTYHDGVDFTPGNGTPVMSIADGVVQLATENGGGLGVNVEVVHNIGGQIYTTSYAHMQYGSLAVVAGQTVTAGQQLGVVGTTGQSTGPHLHLEMWAPDGVRFDGMAWLHDRLG
ncbi:M23 family metallopeptidase [Agromyces protaetiae]|uniref:M23 family metallopeptidase n=1 Tax=Agromyces protaetiae TaxID=2509455 RepID=A0A4P6FCZ9_9MICO|nr:M23 family metallopeptidase [Agromyces protaetiae]QAY73566.1 M23 family metallopeptidase [Agromyces protaetiae]